MSVHPHHSDFNAPDNATTTHTITLPPNTVLESVHMESNTVGYVTGNIFIRMAAATRITKIQLASGPLSLITGGLGVDEITWDGQITSPTHYPTIIRFECRNHTGGTIKILVDASWRILND